MPYQLEIALKIFFSAEGAIRAEISCLAKVWVHQKHMVLVSSGPLTKYSLFFCWGGGGGGLSLQAVRVGF